MKLDFTFVVFLVFSTSCLAQTGKPIEPNQPGIPYDTIFLKNETKLIYSTTDKSRIIRIISPSVDTILRSANLHTGLPSLGLVKADFEDCFVLYDDEDGFDEMQIYKKETGKLMAKGPVVAFDTISKIICYADWDKLDILYLFDFKKSAIEKYYTPSTACLRYWYCIQMRALTATQFTIEYTAKNNVKTRKTYIRTNASQ